MTSPLCSLELRAEGDVVRARRQARDAALRLGSSEHDAARIAAAVWEIARNALTHAGGGTVRMGVEDDALVVRVEDRGAGIPHPGEGGGIAGARRVVDDFRIDAAPGGGTVVELVQRLPEGASATPAELRSVAEALARPAPPDDAAEAGRQNRELLHLFAALAEREEVVARLNDELEETNRGVLALHAELRDRADREAAAREAAEAASRARDAVLAIVSHDLRNPVGSVITAAAFMLDTLADEVLATPQGQQVGVIHRAARRANRLLDDLMDVTRIEAGRLAVDPRPTPVRVLIEGAVEGMRPAAEEHGVRLVAGPVGDLPDVRADHDRILQVFANLAGNAVKFTGDGGTVTLSATREGDRVAFEVADTGPGMTPEQVERAFDRFWQAGRADRRGVGLGLSIARGIVDAHGGSLTLRSAVGEGTVFRFTLPVAP